MKEEQNKDQHRGQRNLNRPKMSMTLSTNFGTNSEEKFRIRTFKRKCNVEGTIEVLN